MSATSDNKTVVLIDKAKSAMTPAKWKTVAPVAAALEAATAGEREAQLNFGRVIGPMIAAMVKQGGDRKAALAYFVQELNTKRAAAQKKTKHFLVYSESHCSTWITAAEGYDSLTPKQRESFNSLDVYRKLAGIPVKQKDQPTRQEFVDSLISAGITSEAAVREAVTLERQRRSGSTPNPEKKIREDTGKVAKQAAKDSAKLSKFLLSGRDAGLFLLGAQWGAMQIDKQKGFNVKAYKDGFAEALHPLTSQPTPTVGKPAAKSAAKPAAAKTS